MEIARSQMHWFPFFLLDGWLCSFRILDRHCRYADPSETSIKKCYKMVFLAKKEAIGTSTESMKLCMEKFVIRRSWSTGIRCHRRRVWQREIWKREKKRNIGWGSLRIIPLHKSSQKHTVMKILVSSYFHYIALNATMPTMMLYKYFYQGDLMLPWR